MCAAVRVASRRRQGARSRRAARGARHHRLGRRLDRTSLRSGVEPRQGDRPGRRSGVAHRGRGGARRAGQRAVGGRDSRADTRACRGPRDARPRRSGSEAHRRAVGGEGGHPRDHGVVPIVPLGRQHHVGARSRTRVRVVLRGGGARVRVLLRRALHPDGAHGPAGGPSTRDEQVTDPTAGSPVR